MARLSTEDVRAIMDALRSAGLAELAERLTANLDAARSDEGVLRTIADISQQLGSVNARVASLTEGSIALRDVVNRSAEALDRLAAAERRRQDREDEDLARSAAKRDRVFAAISDAFRHPAVLVLGAILLSWLARQVNVDLDVGALMHPAP